MDNDRCEAMAESEGLTEVMEGFAVTVKQSGTIQKLTADEVVDMMNVSVFEKCNDKVPYLNY